MYRDTAQRKEEAKTKTLEVLQEVRKIIGEQHNDPQRVNKFLKSKHFKELPINLGRRGELFEPGPHISFLSICANCIHVPVPTTESVERPEHTPTVRVRVSILPRIGGCPRRHHLESE